MARDSGFRALGRNVYVAGAVSLFMDISSEMVYPLVPLFLSSVLGVNKSIIGVIEGLAESTASVMKVFSGWFSDRMGSRKGLMLAGYAVSAASRPIMALSYVWHQVLAARLVDRLGKGIRTSPRDAIIAESTQSEVMGQAFGLHRSMDTLGAVIGPALAFVLLNVYEDGFRTVFWISTIPAVIAVLCIVFFIRETKASARPPAARRERPSLTFRNFDWRFKFFIAVTAVFSFGNSSDVFLILRAQQLGVHNAMIPVMYMSFNLVYALSSTPAGMIADRFGRKRVVLAGFLLFALIYYGFAVADSEKGVWELFCLYGVFMGLTDGVQKAFLATIIPKDFKATAYGVYHATVGLALLPASFIGGMLWDRVAPAATFYFGVTTALISSAMFVVLILLARDSREKPG